MFRRELKGRRLAPVEVLAERGRVRFLAEVLSECDPIHVDIDAAVTAGYPDLVAPPSFVVAIEAAVEDERRRLGQESLTSMLGCDFDHLLHGSERYEYSGLIFAGDTLICTTEIVDFYDKRGGAMEFADTRTDIVHEDRGVLMRAYRTLIHKFS
jgi:acyl dehydratase